MRELPLSTGTLELTLSDTASSMPACAAAQCTQGNCTGDTPPDAGMPMPTDAGHDSGPVGCSSDSDCTNGTCHDRVCCFGCWNGMACAAGTADDACGTHGANCSTCPSDQTCVANACRTPPPVQLSLTAVSSFVEIGGRIWSAGPDGAARGNLDATTANVFDRMSAAGPFVDVAATQFATCAIDGDGHLFCWGKNAAGQLGSGSADFSQTTSSPLQLGAAQWQDVQAGNNHFCAIRNDGHLLCWGSNMNGQLGVTGGVHPSPSEVSVGGMWNAVAGGDQHTCAIRADGALFCWGSNMSGQLGVSGAAGGSDPVQVGTDTDWLAISAGVEHTCGLRGGGPTGDLYCWGTKQFGRLGDGSSSGTADTPLQIDATHSWSTVSAGQYHTCGLTGGGDLYCWGVGAQGATGLGLPGDSATPALVGSGYAVVAAGWTHTCAVTLSGAAFQSLQCWGDPMGGKLGNGDDTTIQHSPADAMLDPVP